MRGTAMKLRDKLKEKVKEKEKGKGKADGTSAWLIWLPGAGS
jgi:hypothetical protein